MSTQTIAHLAAPVTFLAEHPMLPAPRGLDVGSLDGGSITVILDTAEQVGEWASAIGSDVNTTEYKGNTHHSAWTAVPFYVSVVAIVPGVQS